MTGNKIKYALECCEVHNCDECPIRLERNCQTYLRSVLLSEIKVLRKENERLKFRCNKMYGSGEGSVVDMSKARFAYWEGSLHTKISAKGEKILVKLYNCSYCGAPNGNVKSSQCKACCAYMGELIDNGQ